MKENKRYPKYSRYFKVLGIVWALTISYVMLYFTGGELYISRFEGPFLGYIELFLHNYISLDNFNFFPLINPEPLSVDPSLPTKIQGIVTSESWIPNTVSIFVILCSITGLPPHQLIILPLGVFFVPLVIFSIFNRADENLVLNKTIILISIYYIVFFIITRYYGSLYVAALAMTLVFAILLCVIILFVKKTSSRPFWAIFIIMLFSLTQYWHSMLMMILFITVSLCISHILSFILDHFKYASLDSSFRSDNRLFRVILYLLLISGIISITFTHIWESSYMGIMIDSFDIHGYLDILTTKLSGKTAFPVPYVYSYKETIFGQLYFISYLGILILCSFLLIFSIAVQLLYMRKGKYSFSKFPVLLGMSLIISQVIQSIAYYNTSSVNFPIVYLFFPIGAIYIYTVLDKIERQTKSIKLYKKLFQGILILLVILSVVAVVTSNLTKEAGSTPLTKYDDTEDSFNWLFNKIEYDEQLIVDFNILGKYIQREAQTSNPVFEYIDLNPDIYAIWVGDEHSIPTNFKNSVSVVDKRTMSGNLPVQITGSRAALKQEINRINDCLNLNKIYEDHSISLFKFR